MKIKSYPFNRDQSITQATISISILPSSAGQFISIWNRFLEFSDAVELRRIVGNGLRTLFGTVRSTYLRWRFHCRATRRCVIYDRCLHLNRETLNDVLLKRIAKQSKSNVKNNNISLSLTPFLYNFILFTRRVFFCVLSGDVINS